MKKNEKVSLEDYVYEEIKKAILNRKIPPKMQLNEEQLAEVFNVSRTPIRNVLRRLQYEKLVQIIPNKGAYIYEPTVEEIEEVFYLRTILELEAVKLACKVATAEQLDELEKLTYLEEQLYKQGEYGDALPVTTNIHLGMVEMSGNKLMLEYCNELCNLTNVFLAFYDSVQTESPLAPCEHRNIIAAIRERDEEKAVNMFMEHFSRVKSYLRYNHKDIPINLADIFQPYKQ